MQIGPNLVASRTPAVVVGADVDGLGIARSLGKAGIPVMLLDVSARQPGMHSRYVHRHIISALSGQALIEALLALGERLDSKPVLFLTTDRQVRGVSQHRTSIEKAFHIRLPSHDCVCALLHKQGFQREAERYGFRVPRAISVRRESDLAELDSLRFPAVIKPCHKDLFFDNRATRASKVMSRSEAETVCRTFLPEAPDLIVQEWVEGKESDIYFCLQYRGAGGTTIRSFTGRKLRCWPPQTGSTAWCTAAPERQAELEGQTTAFFDKVQFVGMCSMEFKRDSRSGEFFMIEPTVGRTDWQEEIATLNGVNIPLAAYCYEVGMPIPAGKKPRQILNWMYPPSYVRSVLATGVLDGAEEEMRRTKSPFWNLRDPIPLAFFLLEWIRKSLSSTRWRELMWARKLRVKWVGSLPAAGTKAKAMPPGDATTIETPTALSSAGRT